MPRAIFFGYNMLSQPLYDYQNTIAAFGKERSQAAYFAWYGSGKTYLALRWLEERSHDNSMFPCAVVCQKGLIEQWINEIHKHSEFSCVSVIGSSKKRLEALRQPVQIYVMNHDICRNKSVRDYVEYQPYGTAIVDESLAIKNSRTRRWQDLVRVFQDVPNRLLLSGQFISERLEECWSQLFWLDHGRTLGSSFWRWRDTYFTPGPETAPYSWVPKPGATEEIAKKLSRKCIFVSKETVKKQLPPKVYHKVEFTMLPAVRKMYRQLLYQYQTELPDGTEWSTQWAITRTQKMHQLCSGLFYQDEGEPTLIDDSKQVWLVETVPNMVRETGVLIWTNFKWFAKLIHTALSNAKVRVGLHTGDTNNRQSLIDNFQTGKLDCLVLTQQSGYAGLNLQRAGIAIFASTGYSASQRTNAEDRCHRLGSEQHNNVLYYDLITRHSIDTVVYEALKNKSNLETDLIAHLKEQACEI